MSGTKKSPERYGLGRRTFGRSVVAAAAAAALPAQTTRPTVPSPSPQPADQASAQGLSAGETAEIEERYAQAIRKYGDRLSDDQKQRIRRVLTQNERMLSRIREYSVENGDTPATVLKLAAAEPAKGHK
jgi:hypothetical protein